MALNEKEYRALYPEEPLGNSPYTWDFKHDMREFDRRRKVWRFFFASVFFICLASALITEFGSLPWWIMTAICNISGIAWIQMRTKAGSR